MVWTTEDHSLKEYWRTVRVETVVDAQKYCADMYLGLFVAVISYLTTVVLEPLRPLDNVWLFDGCLALEDVVIHK